MIFIAVSAVLFFGAILVFRGQQAQTQFSQAMRDIDSKIQSVINDTSTGFFPGGNSFGCDASAPAPAPIQFTNTPGTQGSRIQCIFLGKALHFAPEGDHQQMNIYTVAGRRQAGAPTVNAKLESEVRNLNEATPSIVFDDDVDLTESYTLRHGMKLKSGATSASPGFMAGFYTSLNAPSATNLFSGTQTVGLSPYFLAENSTKQQAKTIVEGGTSQINSAAGSWTLCFERGDGNQTARLTVGGSGRSTTTTVEFVSC
jgi:hypothetical protein